MQWSKPKPKAQKKNIYVTNQYESSESSYHIEMSVTVRAKPANPPPHPPLVPQHKKGNHLSPALQPSKTKASELRVAAPPAATAWGAGRGCKKKKTHSCL